MSTMTTKQRSPILAATGGLFLIAGIIMGVLPLGDRGDSCGSVFSPQNWGTSILGGICKTKITNIAPVVWGLLIIGVALLLWGLRARNVGPRDPYDQPGLVIPESQKKSAQMDDLIALHGDGTLNAEQFQAAKDRILGKPTVQSGQKTKLDALHASGALSDADYLAAVERLN